MNNQLLFYHVLGCLQPVVTVPSDPFPCITFIAKNKPPTANRFLLRLAAAGTFRGVSGRVFQTDVGLVGW